MKFWMTRSRLFRVWVPTGTVFVLGGCGLSDQQLSGILSSVVTTGLTSLVNNIVTALTAGAGG